MRIAKVGLSNYRQYFGDCEIDIGPSSPKKHFVILEGANGAGKSNLLNAVTWCFYEEEVHLKGKTRALPIVNTVALGKAKTGDKISVNVEVFLEDDDGRLFVASRSADFRKTAEGGVKAIDTSELRVRYMEGRDWKFFGDPAFFIQTRMPKGIKEYFFFDGEHLNKYFQESSNSRIREAVSDISQIALLDKAIFHLADLKGELLRSVKAESSNARTLKENIESVQGDLGKFTEEKQKIVSEKEKLDEQKREIGDRLKEYPVKLVQEKQERRERLKKEMDDSEKQLKELEQKKADVILGAAPLLIARGAIRKSLQLIQESKDAGRIPPQFRKIFIENLLKQGKCICGMDISHKSPHKKSVEDFLNKADEVSDIAGEISTGQGYFVQLLDGAQRFDESRIDLGRQIARLEKQIEDKVKEHNSISEELKGVSIEEVARDENKLELIESKLRDLTGKLAVMEDKIKQTEERVKRWQDELEDELRKERRNVDLVRRVEIIKQTEGLANGIKQRITAYVREKVEESTRKHFFELVWRKKAFREVSINEDYGIRVTHESGLEAMDSLSAGERQVLALSFMAALNEVSGFKAPIIIDTPLGRISDTPTSSIAQNLPDYLSDRQVILLVTDKEYDETVRDLLAPRVLKEFKLVAEDSEGGMISKVVPYEQN